MNHPKDNLAHHTSINVAPHPVIQYIGRSCFLITAPDGTHIVADPYSCAAKYLPFPADVEADLITVSHGIDGFFHMHALRGRPTIISEAIADRIGPVEVTSYDSLRWEQNGICRGINKIFVFKIGSTKIVHLGELGKIERPEVYKAIKDADVMLVPISQVEAMSFDQLNELVARTNARTVIPSYFDISDTEQWFSMSMVGKYIEALPPGTAIVEADELAVMPNMPKQVVILTPRIFKERLSIVERTFVDLPQSDVALQAVLCNGTIDHFAGSSSSAGSSYQSLWMGLLKSKSALWLDCWKHLPIRFCSQN